MLFMPCVFVERANLLRGQFFCGPAVLSKQLHVMSNKYSNPKGTRFFFGKGALFLPARGAVY